MDMCIPWRQDTCLCRRVESGGGGGGDSSGGQGSGRTESGAHGSGSQGIGNMDSGGHSSGGQGSGRTESGTSGTRSNISGTSDSASAGIMSLRLREEEEAAAAAEQEDTCGFPLQRFEDDLVSLSSNDTGDGEETVGEEAAGVSPEVAFYRERLDEPLFSPPPGAQLPAGWDASTWCKLTLREFIYLMLAEKQSGTIRDGALDQQFRLLHMLLPQPNICPPSLYLCLKVSAAS